MPFRRPPGRAAGPHGGLPCTASSRRRFRDDVKGLISVDDIVLWGPQPQSTMSSIEDEAFDVVPDIDDGKTPYMKAAMRSSGTPRWSSERHVCTGRDIT